MGLDWTDAVGVGSLSEAVLTTKTSFVLLLAAKRTNSGLCQMVDVLWNGFWCFGSPSKVKNQPMAPPVGRGFAY